MLQQFTWQQFLIATGAFTLIWYAGVMLLFYPKAVSDFFRGTSSAPLDQGSSVPGQHTQNLSPEEEAPELMGKTKMPEGVSTVSISEIGFEGSEDDKESQIGLIPDVLEEIKLVFSILAKEDGNKRDFINLMKSVRESFPGIGGHPKIRHINEFISSHASFHLSPEELEDLWV